jgi:hypothetical protein
MALSRKNYEAVAAIVKGSRLVDPRTGPASDRRDVGYESALDEVAGRLATYFATDNPRFDRARFLDACGL